MVKPYVVRPLLALCMIGSTQLYAAEGGVGRPITGQQVYSNAGIIPPEPGYNGDRDAWGRDMSEVMQSDGGNPYFRWFVGK